MACVEEHVRRAVAARGTEMRGRWALGRVCAEIVVWSANCAGSSLVVLADADALRALGVEEVPGRVVVYADIVEQRLGGGTERVVLVVGAKVGESQGAGPLVARVAVSEHDAGIKRFWAVPPLGR